MSKNFHLKFKHFNKFNLKFKHFKKNHLKFNQMFIISKKIIKFYKNCKNKFIIIFKKFYKNFKKNFSIIFFLQILQSKPVW